MKHLIFAILLTLTACRTQVDTTRRDTLSVSAADTISTVNARSISTIDREMVWEFVRERPDSTGAMRVVERNVTRHTDKGVSVTADTTHAKTTATSEATTHEENESKIVTGGNGTGDGGGGGVTNFFAIGCVWIILIALVLVLAKYIIKQWTSRL